MKNQIALTFAFASLATPAFGQTRLFLNDADRCIQSELTAIVAKEDKRNPEGWIIMGEPFRTIKDLCATKFPGQYPNAFRGGARVEAVFTNGRETYEVKPVVFGQ